MIYPVSRASSSGLWGMTNHGENSTPRDTRSHDWWKNMKKIMGIETNDSSKIQGLANKVADGNCEMLANSMNDLLCVC